MRRRTVLGLAALGAAGAALAACGDEGNEERAVRTASGPVRHAYGDGPSQYGELHLPDGTPRGVVVVIHGGFWRSQYDADSLGTPLARDLATRGWAAWNLEYRRVGPGLGGEGGAPATFDDVAAGIDLLAELDVDTSTVVTLGHSAGGHLATWAAGRGAHGWAEQVPVTHVISQAGVLDLRAASRERLGAGAVEAFLGHPPTTADARYDPGQQLPLDVPVWCVHGRDDDTVPLAQSVDYVDRARAAGASAELVEVPGDHFVVIDTASAAWARQVEVLEEISADARG